MNDLDGGEPSRRIWAGALLVLCAAALFRFGPAGGPQKPDESYVSGNLLNFHRSASLAPANYIHPPLYHYLCLAALQPGLKRGGLSAAERYESAFFLERESIYKVCRRISWLFSVALPPLLFFIAWKLSGSFYAALLAGLLAAGSSAQAAHARDALPEAMLAFLFTAGAGLALTGLKRKKKSLIYLASVTGGIAAAVKTNGAFLLPLVLWASWYFADGEELPRRRSRAAAGGALLAVLCGCVLFFGLSGAWRAALAAFSPDGIVEADTAAFFGAAMFRAALGAGALLLLAGAFLRGLRRPEGGGGLYGVWVRRSAAWLDAGVPYAVCGLFIAGFLALNPYWALELRKFASTLVLASIHVQYSGHFGMFGQDWAWYLKTMVAGDGFLVLPVLAGLAYGALSLGPSRQAGIYFLAMFIYIGAWEEKAVRFIQFLLPLAFLSAGIGIAEFARRYKKPGYAAGAVIAAALVLQAWQALGHARGEFRPDTRLAAAEWVESNAPAKARLLMDAYFLTGLRSFSELADLRKGGSVAAESEYTKKKLYEVCGPPEAPAFIRGPSDWGRYDYLIVNSDSYRHLFDPAQDPGEGHPLRGEYERKKRFYSSVLGGALPCLKSEAEFGGEGYSGPEIRVYRVVKGAAAAGCAAR